MQWFYIWINSFLSYLMAASEILNMEPCPENHHWGNATTYFFFYVSFPFKGHILLNFILCLKFLCLCEVGLCMVLCSNVLVIINIMWCDQSEALLFFFKCISTWSMFSKGKKEVKQQELRKDESKIEEGIATESLIL